MGYRSEVLFMARGKLEVIMPVLVTFRLNNGDAGVKVLKALSYFFEGETLTLKFHEECIKWYSDYDDVKMLTLLFDKIDELGEDDSSVDTVFIRIGDDTEDTEERYANNGHDLAHAFRGLSIDIDLPTEEQKFSEFMEGVCTT